MLGPKAGKGEDVKSRCIGEKQRLVAWTPSPTERTSSRYETT